jgi:hypothetical protein
MLSKVYCSIELLNLPFIPSTFLYLILSTHSIITGNKSFLNFQIYPIAVLFLPLQHLPIPDLSI